MLLKMDVILKAFDRIEWPFLLACLEKCGLGGMLTRFLKASFVNASSSVLLNGRQTKCVPLSRSIRQGCPLSPLLFILAFDSLSFMFQDAMAKKSIVGVRFPSLDIQALINMYADDFYLLFRACLGYALEVKRILHVFGLATGLICAWDKTVALIRNSGWSASSSIAALAMEMGGRRYSVADSGPGAPVAQTIAVGRVESMLVTKMESKLVKLRACRLSLAARIIVVNSILLGSIWYLIIIWAGKCSFFGQLQRLVDNFVWGGRPWVNRATVAKPRAEGGLSLLGVEA